MRNDLHSLFQLDGEIALVTGASKGIGEAMAQDWGGDNISVNAICPGLIKNQLQRSSMER